MSEENTPFFAKTNCNYKFSEREQAWVKRAGISAALERDRNFQLNGDGKKVWETILKNYLIIFSQKCSCVYSRSTSREKVNLNFKSAKNLLSPE